MIAGTFFCEFHPEGVFTRGENVLNEYLLGLDPQEVVDVVELFVFYEKRMPPESGTMSVISRILLGFILSSICFIENASAALLHQAMT